MSVVLQSLNDRRIAYQPIYKRLTGSVHGAVLLSQMMYWFSKKSKFWKTNQDFMDELDFTERELKTAKASLKKLKFLTITKEGVPARQFYSIDWEIYETCLHEFLSKKVQANPRKSSQDETVLTGEDETVRTGQDETVRTGEDETVRTITKITSKITSKSKKIVKKDFSFSLSKMTQYENLSEEYKRKLEGYSVTKDGGKCYEAFINHHGAKGSSYKNWSLAYNTWVNNQITYSKGDFNPDNYVTKLFDHPLYPVVFKSCVDSRVYNESLECVGQLKVKVSESIPVVEEKQSQIHDVGNLLSGLAVALKADT